MLESSTGPTGGTFVRSLDGTGVAEYLNDSITLLLDIDELTLEELWTPGGHRDTGGGNGRYPADGAGSRGDAQEH